MAICCPWMSRRRQRYDEIDEQYTRSNTPATESSSLLQSSAGSTLVDAYIASYRSWEDDINLWSDPYDITHSRSSQDKELDGFIIKWRTTSLDFEKKLIYEQIQVIRLNRKRVQERWRKVLAELGFTAEADRLVSISRASGIAVPEPPSEQAINMHHVIVYQTNLFGDEEVQDRRYTIILDRLIAVDVAEDFIQKAKEMFPKEPSNLQLRV